MKVIVERTSNWGCEEKPIDEAVLVNRTLHYQDRRNASSMEEAKTEFGIMSLYLQELIIGRKMVYS